MVSQFDETNWLFVYLILGPAIVLLIFFVVYKYMLVQSNAQRRMREGVNKVTALIANNPEMA